jgi:hypothetical protein
MSNSSPLTGVILIDCARANAKYGLTVTAEQCGYGKDTTAFQTALQKACHDMGVEVADLAELIAAETDLPPERGMDVSPDSPSRL